jgi:Gluconate 2-dehydrogenase subunit 3
MAKSIRDADHLPHQREGGEPADPHELPRQRRGTTPQMHGRYPDYDVLDNAPHWDEVTRRVVLDRVANPPPIRFFTEEECRVIGPFLDVVLAQDAEPRVPVLNMVDAKMFEGKLDGYQYADMPDDRDVWRIVARGLAQEGFLDATDREREEIVGRFADGKLEGGAWDEVNVTQAWSVVTRGALSEFYSHPWAWNEIGFGGPAYPRGYMRLQPGRAGREPYEAAEAFDRDPVSEAP